MTNINCGNNLHTSPYSGEFYAVEDECLDCGMPTVKAPALMGLPCGVNRPCCKFVRQPANREELEQALNAMNVSCVSAIRYRGNDPIILAEIEKRGMAEQIDPIS